VTLKPLQTNQGLGLVRVAAASPHIRVAQPLENAKTIISLATKLAAKSTSVVVTPELSLCGYTCGDLFLQQSLQDQCLSALAMIVEASAHWNMVVIIGLPISCDNRLYNCAAVVQAGKLCGLVPKTHLPNYKEFYERRWFEPASSLTTQSIEIGGESIPLGANLLFELEVDAHKTSFAIEICEDLWTPLPPSSYASRAGAQLIFNLSASNETVGKASYRRKLVETQSQRCIVGYVYAGSGAGESSTDLVFGGQCLVTQGGELLNEAMLAHGNEEFILADIDVEQIQADRQRVGTFFELSDNLHKLYQKIALAPIPQTMTEIVPKPQRMPFLPRDVEIEQSFQEILEIQVQGLKKRLEHVGANNVVLGISGGLDSTWALIVVCEVFDRLKIDRQKIQGITMPGFGTTDKTLNLGHTLMQALGVSTQVLDIKKLTYEELKVTKHQPFGLDLELMSLDEFASKLRTLPEDKRQDLTFENVQARLRTSLLMNKGFVIGTGDLSELALGWCTFNADHMSMYNPNVSLTKTLIRELVRWYSTGKSGPLTSILQQIAGLEFSPELLPLDRTGQSPQSTEDHIGPYELHDFFLYYVLAYGFSPKKILFLAEQVEWSKKYTHDEIKRWLILLIKRFFSQQYKRSTLPDGPKVLPVSLSPRGDWRMPSDVSAESWLSELS
jgi:NAD+ synthase (glutamine-hydrolysing)